ncbi:HigA family addiction module antitoxin [Oceanicaulis alexandrii]|uniref:HigA family addiction module antitoxin n=1 Tax=Oceanicaulis alexandrii TaxID=153233 RepID=UPI0035CF0EBD
MKHDFKVATEPVGAHLADFMNEFGIKAPTLAKKIGVQRHRVTRLLDGARCDADMALRLARLFGTTPEYWLNLQKLHDLSTAHVEAGSAIVAEIEPLEAPAA